jgi:VWFA-related protein
MLFKISSLLLIALSISLAPPCFSQSPEDKRPKLKDFGSSLKRLKWDPVTQKAVDTKSSDQPSTSSEEDVVRIETTLVTCDILVVDARGNLVENLAAEDFIVSEDGQPQQIAHFLRGDNAAVGRSIVLIFDYSRSQLPFLRRSINAAKLMVDKLAPLDLMAIVTDDVELLVDFTSDKEKLKEALESIVQRTRDKTTRSGIGPKSRFGKSDQYSALLAILKEAFRPEDLRPIVVFQTDGDEAFYFRDSNLRISAPPDVPDDQKAHADKNAEKYTQRLIDEKREFGLRDIYQAAERSRATIYTVVPGVHLIDRTPDEQLAKMKKLVEQIDAQGMSHLSREVRAKVIANRERHRLFSDANLMAEAKSKAVIQGALAGVAQRAGGWTEFLETPEQAEGIYDRILADINRRYLIGYYPTNKEQDGKRRKIKIEIKGHPEYHILGRTSYFAPM